MEYPLVTVFTLIYNTNPTYIIDAIVSVQKNNYPNIQHIIIDDCSTNKEKLSVIKKWIKENNYSCEFYEHDVNYGICKSINHVLELSKGKYILGCCDDMLLPNRIFEDVQLLEKSNPETSLVYSMCQYINEKNEKLSKIIPQMGLQVEHTNLLDQLLKGNFIAAPSVTIKTEILKTLDGYDTNYLIEDYAMWLKMAEHNYHFLHRPEVTTLYRVHSENFTNANSDLLELEDFKIKLDFSNNKRHKLSLERMMYKKLLQNKGVWKKMLDYYVSKYNKSLFYYLIKYVSYPTKITAILKVYFKILNSPHTTN